MVKLPFSVCIRILVIFLFLAAIVDLENCQGVADRFRRSSRHPRSPFRLRKRTLNNQDQADSPLSHFRNDSINGLPRTTANFTHETAEPALHISTMSAWRELGPKTSNSSTESLATQTNSSGGSLAALFGVDRGEKNGEDSRSSYVRRKRWIRDDEPGDETNAGLGRQPIYGGTLLDLDSPFNDVDPTFDQDSEGKPHVRVKRDNVQNSRYESGYINDLVNSFPQISPAFDYLPPIEKRENKPTSDLLASGNSGTSEWQEGDKGNPRGDDIRRSQSLKDNDHVLSTLAKYPMDDSLTAKIDLDEREILNPSQDSTAIKLIRRKRYDYVEAYPESRVLDSQSNEESKLIHDFPQQKLFRRNNANYGDYYTGKSKLRLDRDTLMDSSYSEDAEEDNGLDTNDLYMDTEEQSNPNAYENQQSPRLERKKRYDNTNAYLDPNFMDAHSSGDYSPKNNAKLLKRSNEGSNNYPLMGNENGFRGNDLMRMQGSEYRPLQSNGKHLVGETARFRRVPDKLSGRRTLRKTHSKKRGRKKHKKRKGAKRARKNVQGKRMGLDGERKFARNREIRLGWPEVVDEMQVESRIEKRDSNDGKSEMDIAKREVDDNSSILPGKGYRRRKKNVSNNVVGEMNTPECDNNRERESKIPAEVRHFHTKRESVKDKSLADEMSKESLKEKREDVEEKAPGTNEAQGDIQAEVNDIPGNKGSVEERAEYEKSADDQPSSSKDEEEAALIIGSKIKRLVDAYGGAIQANSKNDEGIGDLENGEESLKSRVKRHESLPSKQARNNVDDSQELRYYENVREPEDTALQGGTGKENIAVDRSRGDRAVRSLEEIKVLAERLFNKVNDLQSYVIDASHDRSNRKRRKKKVQLREANGCYSNMTKILATTTEKPSKVAERCVPARNNDMSSKEKPRNVEEKSKRSGENTAMLTKAENVAYAEEDLAKRAEPTVVDRGKGRRKRKSRRKWDRWTDWSSCSVTCGKGRQIRWRHCIRDCDTAETEMEEKACQLPACAPGKFLGIFR